MSGETLKDKILGGWLSSDLQSAQLDAKQVNAKINKAREGKLDEWIRTGNAYTFSIENKKCLIQDVYSESEDVFEYSFDEIEEAVGNWLKFVRENAL